jgi:hypothetical protein
MASEEDPVTAAGCTLYGKPCHDKQNARLAAASEPPFHIVVPMIFYLRNLKTISKFECREDIRDQRLEWFPKEMDSLCRNIVKHCRIILHLVKG